MCRCYVSLSRFSVPEQRYWTNDHCKNRRSFERVRRSGLDLTKKEKKQVRLQLAILRKYSIANIFSKQVLSHPGQGRSLNMRETDSQGPFPI